MDEDKKQASHPSTSKIEDRSNNSRQDVREEEQDVQSNSFASESSAYTERSYITNANDALEMSKINRIMKEISEQKKGKSRLICKVQRRRARPRATKRLRRHVKYETRHRTARKNRDFSVSTLFRGIQSRCQYCGHRCRRRLTVLNRFKGQQRRKKNRRRNGRRLEKIKISKRRPYFKKSKLKSGLVCIQAGSTSKMLSSLFMATNNELTEWVYKEEYDEISPEMICEALEKLGKWKQSVNTISILNYVRMNYPVTRDVAQLENDLREKLRVATVTGIVTDLNNDNWELTTPLQEQKLTDTHVTLFWKIYADTMTPISGNKNVQKPEQNTEDTEIALSYQKMFQGDVL